MIVFPHFHSFQLNICLNVIESTVKKWHRKRWHFFYHCQNLLWYLVCLVTKYFTDGSWWICCVTALCNLINQQGQKSNYEENVTYECLMKCTSASSLHFNAALLNLYVLHHEGGYRLMCTAQSTYCIKRIGVALVHFLQWWHLCNVQCFK